MPPRRHRVVITHACSPRNTGAVTRPNPRHRTAPVFIQRSDVGPRDDYRLGDEHRLAVLLIHGQPGSALIWAYVEPLLRARGLDVHVVDDCALPLDQPTVIVGHGLGADLAVALAATAPSSARALILIGPAMRAPAIPIVDRILARPVLGSAIAWLAFRGAGLALRLPRLRGRLLPERGALTTGQAEQLLRSLRRGRAWRLFVSKHKRLIDEAKCLHRRLGQIHCPTMVIAGRRDDITPFPVVSALAAQLPGAPLVATDTGHLIPIDDPDIVLNAVLRACEFRQSPAAEHQTQQRN